MTVDASRSCLGLVTSIGPMARQIVDARVLLTAAAPPALPSSSVSAGSLAPPLDAIIRVAWSVRRRRHAAGDSPHEAVAGPMHSSTITRSILRLIHPYPRPPHPRVSPGRAGVALRAFSYQMIASSIRDCSRAGPPTAPPRARPGGPSSAPSWGRGQARGDVARWPRRLGHPALARHRSPAPSGARPRAFAAARPSRASKTAICASNAVKVSTSQLQDHAHTVGERGL